MTWPVTIPNYSPMKLEAPSYQFVSANLLTDVPHPTLSSTFIAPNKPPGSLFFVFHFLPYTSKCTFSMFSSNFINGHKWLSMLKFMERKCFTYIFIVPFNKITDGRQSSLLFFSFRLNTNVFSRPSKWDGVKRLSNLNLRKNRIHNSTFEEAKLFLLFKRSWMFNAWGTIYTRDWIMRTV